MLHWTVYLKGEPKRYHKAAVAVGHNVYSFGGYCYDETYQYNMGQIDVHIFNTVSLRWRKLPPVTAESAERPLEVPSMRYDHTAVLIEDTIYIWGGSSKDTREDSNVLYAFDVDTHRWFKPEVSGTIPEARYFHSACVLGKVMYIYGGCTRCTDIYTLDTTTMVWSLVNTGSWEAPASFWHSATIIGTNMFVFGGIRHHDVDPYHNIRVFDTETNSWLSMPAAQVLPEARWSHSSFAYNGELYIFGGATRSFNDFWKFNPKTFSWKKVQLKGIGPYTRMSFMCCCMVGERIILFGGYSTPDDLFILDLSPCLKTLCKLAVIQYRLEQSGLPHNIRWELAAMTTNSSRKRNSPLRKK